jgi:hypothetical protein
MTDTNERAAIHRIGKVYMREDGMTVIDGWHIGPALGAPPPSLLTDQEQQELGQRWAEETVRAAQERQERGDEPSEPADPDTEVIQGWTLRELAELSVTLGEGATLDGSR